MKFLGFLVHYQIEQLVVFHCSGDSKGQPALQQMEKSVNAWKENEMKWNGKSATIQEYVQYYRRAK